MWRTVAMVELREVTAAQVRPTLGGITPILRVADLDASVAYYVERLGFSLQWRADPVASVRRDGAALMLCAGDQGQAGTWVWASTSDADALYEEFQRRGARLRHPPSNYPWGSRECQVSDPDGHVLRFGADLRMGEPMGEWLDGDGRRWLPASDGSWHAAE
jgi:catechol 2,3-dioxygenase-like lactoylglutathione lyase family enzyme